VSSEDVAAMRADPIAQAAMKRVIALCESASPGLYRLVAHVDVRDGNA
jgi:hypothetical protein